MKCWTRRSTSWNQDCWEKYQQPQIYRWYHSNGKSEEELKSLLMKVKEESKKAALKLNIQKSKIQSHHFIANRWGGGMETDRFYFLWLQITVDSDCSHEIKRCLLLGRKAMSNLDSVLETREIILPTKVHIVKAMVFPVVMYGCESWTIKKVESWWIDAFKLWSWRRLLRVPWMAWKSNQSILKEISPEYSLEGLMLKLKLPLATWCWSWSSLWPPDVKSWPIGKDPTHWNRPQCSERLRAGGEGGGRGWDGWMASLTQWTWVWANSWR